MPNYVTREELAAHLDPMRNDISEIKADVKRLLGEDAGESAVSSFRRRQHSTLMSIGALLVAGASAALSVIHPH